MKPFSILCRPNRSWRQLAALATAIALTVGTGHPVEAANKQDQKLVLELNRADDIESSCRVTFVLANGLAESVKSIGFELVLFNAEGLVERFSTVEFGAVGAGKTVVRRFDLADLSCGKLSRILVNGISRCEGSNLSTDICTAALTAQGRSGPALDM